MKTLAELTGKKQLRKKVYNISIEDNNHRHAICFLLRFGQLLSPKLLITLDTFDVISLRQQQWNLV